MTAVIAPPVVSTVGGGGGASAGVLATRYGITNDNVPYYTDGEGWQLIARLGTAAAPIITGSGPTIKISRTESIIAATMPAGIGANNQGNAALWAAATGDANNQAQVSALLGTAATQSTQARSASVNPDSCAVQGLAAVQGAGIGRAAAMYGHGRRDTNTGTCLGAEFRSSNFTASDGVYTANGASDTMGVWVTAGGNLPSAAAFAVGTFGGSQTFHVGYAVTSASTTDAAFRDDSQAATSLLINGTHATAAIAVKAGAGAVLIGETAIVSASALLEVNGGAASVDPLINAQVSGANNFMSVRFANAGGGLKIGIAGSANNFLSGSANGDACLLNTGAHRVGIGGTKLVVSVTSADLLGFFGAAEVAQPATQGTVAGFTAGAGTAMNSASTSTGGSGVNAYTFGDVILALKNLGLLHV